MGVSRVFWDTNLFIYLFEDAGERADRVAALRSRMLERRDDLLTSTLTIGEILVKPLQALRTDLARQYEQRIAQVATIVPFDMEAARAYGSIRASAGIKGADAVQLACASAARANLFVTNDERLGGRSFTGIDFVVSLSRVPL